jgi:hypothetical protein
MDEPRPPEATVHLIPAGHEGRLSAPGRDQVPVRVFERGSDVLMLVVLLDADTGLAPEPIEPVLLEYTSAQGLVRLRGQADTEQRDLIRFVPAETPEVLQRREFVRIDAPQPVHLTAEGAGEAVRTHAVDVSGGGMLVRGLEGYEEGHRLRFTLELGPDQPPIEGTARVVRTLGNDGQCGVVFEAISTSERQRLIRFIFDRQRVVRARTRDGARRTRRTR